MHRITWIFGWEASPILKFMSDSSVRPAPAKNRHRRGEPPLLCARRIPRRARVYAHPTGTDAGVRYAATARSNSVPAAGRFQPPSVSATLVQVR